MSSNRRTRSPGESSVLQLLSDLRQVLPVPGPWSPHPVNRKGMLAFLQPPLQPTRLPTLLCAQKSGPCGLYHPDTLAGWPPGPRGWEEPEMAMFLPSSLPPLGLPSGSSSAPTWPQLLLSGPYFLPPVLSGTPCPCPLPQSSHCCSSLGSLGPCKSESEVAQSCPILWPHGL